MLKLVISDDEGKTTVVPLVRDEITIGRKEGNTIRLTERNISRKHAKLRRVNGGFLVEDLASYNGIKVNGRKIEKESALQAGDQIGIGDYLLALQEEAAAEAAAAAAAPAAQPPPPPVAAAPAPGQAPSETPTAVSAPPAMAIPDVPTAMVSAPVDVGPPARLVMISPPAPGAEFALSRPRMRIGRAEDLDICVTHKSISREHVELTQEAGGLRVRDLGSANGVRLNGRDITDSLVSPGDVVELGQVRFKYVAAGAAYTFDEGRTVQMEAMPGPTAKSRAPLLIAVAIIALALIGTVGVLVATSGGGNDTVTTTPVAGGPGPGTPALPAIGAADAAYTQAMAACQAATAGGAWAQALQAAQTALTLRPGDAAAADCQSRASAGVSAQATFDSGVSALRQGNVEGAYFSFEQLPADSPLRQRPEVAQATSQFASTTLERARGLVQSDPREANRLATTVVMMTAIPPDVAAEARSLQAQTRGGGQLVAHNNPPPHGGGNNVPPHGGGNNVPPHGGGNNVPPHGGGNTTQVVTPPHGGGQTTNVGGGGSPPPGGGGAADDASRLVRARACAINGDNACVIRELSGAHSQAEMDMLIQAYRDSGNLGAALPVMRRYVERFPSSARANGYRQILNLHPGN